MRDMVFGKMVNKVDWFDKKQVSKIKNNEYDWMGHFQYKTSIDSVDPNSNFYHPKGFDQKLAEIQEKLKKL